MDNVFGPVQDGVVIFHGYLSKNVDRTCLKIERYSWCSTSPVNVIGKESRNVM